MANNLFDWEQDPELSTSSNIINIPLSDEQIVNKAFENLNKGFYYSEKGLLQKEVTYEESNIKTYDPAKVKLDDKGRKYFIDKDGLRVYFDTFGSVYYTRCDVNGANEQEYINIGENQILIFIDASHTIGVTEEGWVYEYNTETECYEYNPTLKIHPNSLNR